MGSTATPGGETYWLGIGVLLLWLAVMVCMAKTYFTRNLHSPCLDGSLSEFHCWDEKANVDPYSPNSLKEGSVPILRDLSSSEGDQSPTSVECCSPTEVESYM